MSKAIVARENGDLYQRMVLWLHITELMQNNSNYNKLYTEHPEIKSFDDIVIEYKQPYYKQGERIIIKEFIQTKFHQYESDTITVDNLMSAKFVNSTRYSFLQKLKKAYEQLGEKYLQCAFTLYSTFEINQSDILYSAVANYDGFIVLDKIFDGTIRTSRAQAIKKMKEHLQVEEDELRTILGQLRFQRGPRYNELIDLVNINMNSVSLKRVSMSSAVNPYSSLASKWLSGGITELTSEFIRVECLAEDLFNEYDEGPIGIAIKTFTTNTNYLSDNKIDTLDLTESFKDGKYLTGTNWSGIKNEILQFIDKHEILAQYELHLACSMSVGFIAGRVANSKSGYSIYPVQKTADGLKPWNHNSNSEGKKFEETLIMDSVEDKVSDGGTILIISVTQDIERDVQDYLKEEGITYSRILKFTHKNIGQHAIGDGRECVSIALFIADILNRRNRSEKMELTHVFVAAPVSLMFYLGKYSLNFGNLQLYEHDLYCSKNKVYWKSVSIVGGEENDVTTSCPFQ